MKKISLLVLSCLLVACIQAQDMTPLVQKVRAKIEQVKDYVAVGTMKTDVSFIKAPIGKVKVYFKKPDLFSIKKEGGISLLPKGGVSINMSSLMATTSFVALSAGEAVVDGIKTRVVKLLPMNENSEVILTTLYIQEATLLVLKAVTSTRENGTYEMTMQYGSYQQYGLPDKVIFSFNTKDYKLPKGITLEFEEETKPLTEAEKIKNRKGRVEINYSAYTINQGLADAVFKK
jgi:outer membrane lipoprotein-sorting protein